MNAQAVIFGVVLGISLVAYFAETPEQMEKHSKDKAKRDDDFNPESIGKYESKTLKHTLVLK